jgi:hypothetical protein
MTGDDALTALERDAWLSMMQERGRVLDIEIRHESR